MRKYINGINSSTYEMLFPNIRSLKESTECSRAFDAIEEFNQTDMVKFRRNIYDDKITKCGNGEFQYKEGDFAVNFYRLIDILPTEFYGQKLICQNHHNRGYAETVNMAPFIPRGDLLVGYVNLLGNDVICSVIEIKIGNSTIILDGYLNVLMFKEEYLKLTNFREVSKIKHEDLVEDNDNMLVKRLGLSSEAYLFFRKEIVEDVEKNKRLFKKI